MERAVPLQNKTTFEVQVAGLPLKIRSSYDEDTVRGLVQVLDEKVKEITNANPNISFQKAIVLASLHFAEEGMLLKRAFLTELNSLEIKAKDVLASLESTPRLRLDN